MADIVISYKREEQHTARALADALRTEGWTVWWHPKRGSTVEMDNVSIATIGGAKTAGIVTS